MLKMNSNRVGLLVILLLAVLTSDVVAAPRRLPGRTSGKSHRQRAGVPAQQKPRPQARPKSGPPAPKAGPKPYIWGKNRQARRYAAKGGGSLFRYDLTKTKGVSRSAHRRAANRKLAKAMRNNPNIRKSVTAVFGPDAWTRVRKGKNPMRGEWDHSRKGRHLDLRTNPNHALITKLQGPTGGGYAKFYKQRAKR
jgi:hypothetical protein